MRIPKLRLPQKETLLSFAELIDAYRVFPRTILAFYGYYLWYVSEWFMPIANPTNGQTAFAVTLAGSIPVIIGLYQNSGRSWSEHNRSFMAPKPPQFIFPQTSPNINMGYGQFGQEPPVPPRAGPAGTTAGPYDNKDIEGD